MTDKRPRRAWLVPLLLSAGSVACVLAVLTAALMLLPDRLIGPTRWVMRTTANQAMDVTWRPSDGDVFAALPGQVRPPADDAPYAAFRIAWDADGFRVPAEPHESYPVAVFGDSFTEGFNVERPYADGLADALGVGVRNYGYRAYGPVEIAQAAAEFAAAEPRQWVLWGYFSGNDLGDAVREPRIDVSNPIAAWGALFDRLRPPAPTPTAPPDESGAPRYNQPLPVIIGGSYYELAFVSYYAWWQQTPPDAASSRNADAVRAALDAFDAALPPETCRAIVFIPPKELVYARYIVEGDRQFVNAANQRIVTTTGGALTFAASPVDDEDAYFDSLYAHRDLIAALLEERVGWRLIDLTPAFEAAAADERLLYYPYDTHWNQAGHDLAAQVIAGAIEGGC
ncbi:MAG: hypothetical protein IPM16_23000 [Chloroflexi bacterium]|nr:hypothetical protein [Chloroflexota bacterium]